MNIQWLLMAEAVTQDARGAMTAVGVSQTVLVAPELPIQAKRAVIALISAEQGEIGSGDKVAFSISVISPAGDVLSKNAGHADIQPPPWPDLPPSFNLASESVFTATDYGCYRIMVTVRVAENPELVSESSFWVIAPR